MADDEPADREDGEERVDESNGPDEEKSFRERVEEIRERRAEEVEGEEGDRSAREEKMREMMGGGGPGGAGGPGGMGGGNPFAQMMSGMMGGGPGGPGGMGGEEKPGDERLVREVRQLRDEVRDATRQLQRIADALEDDD